MIRSLLIFSLTLMLACSPRGHVTLDPQAASVGQVERIFIGTTRKQDQDGSFGTYRSEQINFARYDVSVPPDRQLGEINWPPRHGKANPAKHFLTTDQIVYQNDVLFRKELHGELAANGGEAVIFVHGYNNNFSEGVYRVAQFSHDLKLPGAVVHYAWPSAAEPLGYAYDRDSALFARDGLESLMHEVAGAGAKRILIVAHSMGAGLTMEALRQTAIRGDKKTLSLIGGVVFISPDIDVDVFKISAHAMGALPQPFVIFGSDRDKYLRLSALLTGQDERLGSLTDVSRVADLKVTFMDVGAFSKGSGHFVVGDSAALIAILDRLGDVSNAFEADRQARIGLLPGVVMTVQNATQIVLRPVATVASDLTR
ncbi:MAG: alpha/beta fold hydrolase [Cypionkella sp.]|uniref:alpha/beta hydrolase n=1 Tax=Cypionkella sp. TaxID=2811411 RepID=UPI002ABA2D55|nr:alpha/beta fold hydrolase [Cypionkella sp.]MDZ4312258.1 alpha/beta fold hydrolase [Cypionkella sp.]MDZ4391550.1 alpha/beta fold hydrolase [Cypionkella sp.]